jgi:uncharacterized Zn-binding protein involved in type VI secretion
MKAAANSQTLHTCPLTTPATHTGGNITPSQTKVMIEGLPAIVQTDVCICAAGGPHSITQGSFKVKIQGKGMVGGMDLTGHLGGMVDIATSSKKVFIK